MANQERGELTLVAPDAIYTLALTVQTVCAVETAAGRPFAAVCAAMQHHAVRDLRLLIWAALQPYHAAIATTLGQAGAVIDAAGGWRVVTPIACRLLRLNADPRPPPLLEGGRRPADPRRAAQGHGNASTWMRDAWA